MQACLLAWLPEVELKSSIFILLLPVPFLQHVASPGSACWGLDEGRRRGAAAACMQGSTVISRLWGQILTGHYSQLSTAQLAVVDIFVGRPTACNPGVRRPERVCLCVCMSNFKRGNS
jgi:hypothetical protein